MRAYMDEVNGGILNSLGSMIGLLLLMSIALKITNSRTTDMRINDIVGSVNDSPGAMVRKTTKATRNALKETVDGASMLICFLGWDSLIHTCDIAKPAIASGMLKMKISLQVTSVKTPPMSGPMDVPSAMTAEFSPIPLLSSNGYMASVMMARLLENNRE